MPYQPDENEQAVLDVLRTEGRANPQLIRDLTDLRKQYVNDALRQLQKAELVRKVTRGLYEYTGDDAPDETDLRGRLQNALEARDDQRARGDRLESELEDCREQLEQARAENVDIAAIRYAIRDLRTAIENGDRATAQAAVERIEEAIGE